MLDEGFGFRIWGLRCSVFQALVFYSSFLPGSPFLASVPCSLGPAFRSVCLPYTEARKRFRIDHVWRPRYKLGLLLG